MTFILGPLRRTGTYGTVVGLTLVSQVFSALSTLVLPLLGLKEADVIAVAAQVGYSSLTGVAMGLIYNLVIGRPWFSHWKKSTYFAAAFPFVVTGISVSLQASTGTLTEYSLGSFLEFSIGGAALAVAGVWGVRLACEGNPKPLAGVSISPNLGMLLCVLGAKALGLHDGLSIALVGVGWCLGSASALLYVRRRLKNRPLSIDVSTRGKPGEPRHGMALHLLALSLGLVVSSVYPPLFGNSTLQLATGTTFFLILTTKIVSSGVNLGVNSVLLVRYNWQNRPKYPGKLLNGTLASCLLLLLAGIACHQLGASNEVSYVTVALGWAGLTVGSAISSRFLNALRRGHWVLVRAVADLALGSLSVAVLTATPSATGYFGAFGISSAVTALVLGLSERRISTTLLSIGGLIACMSLLLLGW
jgi:hypothetical protein